MARKPLTRLEELARRLRWPGWLIMGMLSQVGAGIGALASDTYWIARWHWEYHGERGRKRWQEKMAGWERGHNENRSSS